MVLVCRVIFCIYSHVRRELGRLGEGQTVPTFCPVLAVNEYTFCTGKERLADTLNVRADEAKAFTTSFLGLYSSFLMKITRT